MLFTHPSFALIMLTMQVNISRQAFLEGKTGPALSSQHWHAFCLMRMIGLDPRHTVCTDSSECSGEAGSAAREQGSAVKHLLQPLLSHGSSPCALGCVYCWAG